MHRRTSLARHVLCLGLVTLGGACGGGGGGGEPPFVVAPLGTDLNASEERALSPVTISATALPAEVEVDDVVRFRITARVRTPAPFERITIALQNPPPGCVFPTDTGPGGTFTAPGRWIVNAASAGPIRLSFRVISSSQGVFRRSFDLRVSPKAAPVSQAQYGGHGVLTGDVTGDGLLDVVALATSDGADDRGALYVFAGSTTPTSSPTATLRDPSGSTGDRLGFAFAVSPAPLPLVSLVHLVDVTGDGILDVVAGAPLSDRGAIDAGAIFVWAGGPALSGSPAPTKVLQAPVPTASERLGGPLASPDLVPFVFADVTGSPARDLLVASPSVDGGGAVYVFEGGTSLTGGVAGGTLAPTARLLPPVGHTGDPIGLRLGAIQAHDVTGDGRADVLVSNAFVFAGGASMTGDVRAATLVVTPPGGIQARVTSGTPALRFGDVTGDGVDDVIGDVGEATAVDGRFLAGLGCVWRGRAAFVGDVEADHLLSVAVPQNGDEQGSYVGYALGDVTGDGVLDVLAPAPGDGLRPGELRLWEGGAFVGVRQDAMRLRAAAGTPYLGIYGVFFQTPVHLGDVTGDGIDDVVVELPTLFSPGAAGCLVFQGGANLDRAPGSVVLESATFASPNASEVVGLTGRHGVQLEDLDGDGALDVLADATPPLPAAPTGVRLWKGRPLPSGTILPSAFLPATLTVPLVDGTGVRTLANVSECVTIADLDRDGLPEVIALVDASTGGVATPVARVFGGATLFAPIPQLTSVTLGDSQAGASADANGLHGAHAPVQVADVTGEGDAEVIGGAPLSNASATGAGCVYLWTPRPTAPTVPNPTSPPVHRVRPPRSAGARFPAEARGPQGVLLCDLTGDGVVEVVACNPLASGGDGEIVFVGGGVPFPTTFAGTNGRFFAGASADGLTR